MKKILLYSFFWFFLIVSCHQNDTRLVKPESSVALIPQTVLQLDERFKMMDSVVVVYYTNPYTKDSLQYTRFYKQVSLIDSDFIHTIKSCIDKSFEKIEQPKPCRSEGKIWCFTKGKVFQTIYFSQHISTCNFVYIIKDGMFYYTVLDMQLSEQISRNKSFAKEPSVN